MILCSSQNNSDRGQKSGGYNSTSLRRTYSKTCLKQVRPLRTLDEWNSRGFPGDFQQNSRLFLCDFVQQKRNSRSFALVDLLDIQDSTHKNSTNSNFY